MQGPPGTGKTYTAAEQILELIAHARTAGITGTGDGEHGRESWFAAMLDL